jgi:hypothetical protein
LSKPEKKPAKPVKKIPLYGTQRRLTQYEPSGFQEWEPKVRICVECRKNRPDDWYEYTHEGWVCQHCMAERPRPGVGFDADATQPGSGPSLTEKD